MNGFAISGGGRGVFDMAGGQHGAVLRDVHRLFDEGTAVGVPERSLLERFVGRRDEAAFAALVARHGPLVLGVCRRWLRDPHDVEDAFQAVFLILVRRAGAIRDRDLLGPWLYGVAHRVATRARTVAARRRQREQTGAVETAVTFPCAVDLNELRAVLDEEVNRLPARFRLPVVLCYLEGLTQEETARRLRWTPGTVRGRLAKAREKLRAQLSRRGFALPAGLLAAALAPETTTAALPASLLDATVEGSLRSAAGTTLAATSAAQLAEGVARSMTLTGLKAFAWLIPLVGLTLAVLGQTSTQPPAGTNSVPQSKTGSTGPKSSGATVKAVPPEKAIRIFDFRVVDARTNAPVEGVRVSFSHGGKMYRGVTDRQGRFPVPLPPRSRDAEHFGAFVWKDGYSPTRVSLDDNDDGKWGNTLGGYTLLLKTAGPMSGLVRDEHGKPIVSAKVAVAFPERPTSLPVNRDPLDGFGPFVTDADGRWRCRALPGDLAGSAQIFIRLTHPDFVSDVREPINPAPSLASLRDGTCVMVMSKGVRVLGTVVDPAKRPVAGASVALVWSQKTGDERYTTRTDARGQFDFPHARVGTQSLLIQAAGFAPELRSIEAKHGAQIDSGDRKLEADNLTFVGDDRKDVVIPFDAPKIRKGTKRLVLDDFNHFQLQLGPGRTINGRVVDRKGRPVAGITIRSGRWRGSSVLDWQTETTADGRFHWEHAPIDTVFVRVIGQGLDDQPRLLRVGPDDNDVIAKVKNPLSVRVTVIDAETGKPIDAVRAAWWSADNAPREMSRPSELTSSFRAGHYEIGLEKIGMFYTWYDQPDLGRLKLRVDAKGYAPAESRVFEEDEGEQTFNAKLQRANGVEGTVRLPDGSPLAGAHVFLAMPSKPLEVHNRSARGPAELDKVVTKADGRFWFAVPSEPYWLVALSDRGVAITNALLDASGLKIESWGRIEGTMRIGEGAAAGAPVLAIADRWEITQQPPVRFVYESQADPQGRFRLERVVPGEVRVGRSSRNDSTLTVSHPITTEVEPGKTATVAVGGTGRPVIGRLAVATNAFPPTNFQTATAVLHEKPPLPYPKDFSTWEAIRQRIWKLQFPRTEAGRAFSRRDNTYMLSIAADGTFRGEDIPAGTYTLMATLPPAIRTFTPGRTLTSELIVPEVAGGRSADPLDFGAVSLSPAKGPKLPVGSQAPIFNFPTLDGEDDRLSLADFRGKYVLLSFWTSQAGPAIDDVSFLKNVQDRFGRNSRFALISLSVDDQPDSSRKYVAERGLNWIQGYLGARSSVIRDYGVYSFPHIFLIGPDGKIIAEGLRGEKIEQGTMKMASTTSVNSRSSP